MLISTEPPASAKWIVRDPVTKAKALLNGLTSGTKIWVRVRGFDAAGEGVWSDPVAKTVP